MSDNKITSKITGTIAVTLGEYLRVLRVKNKMSQSDLAARCGVNRNTISKIERDDANCTLDTLQAVFAAFGMVLDIKFKDKQA